jgi:putative transposase
LPTPGWHAFPDRPETLLRWHRELIRGQWVVFGRRLGPGRPPLPSACRDLILRLATGNPQWGYQRIRGELLKLGFCVSATTIRALLRRHRVPPAPRRAGLAWRAFLHAHAQGVLARDFFTVDTIRVQTLFGLFFIELQTRRVFVAGCAEHPSAAWVTQHLANWSGNSRTRAGLWWLPCEIRSIPTGRKVLPWTSWSLLSGSRAPVALPRHRVHE